MVYPVLVIGLGTAATSAIRTLRELGFAGKIGVVSDAEQLPYSPVLTSYYVSGTIERDACWIADELELARLGIDVIAGHPVIELRPCPHQVKLSDGTVLGYEKLIVASGASPDLAHVPDLDGHRPLVLHTMADADVMREALSQPACKRALIMGTSLVALKCAEACLAQGVEPTMLGRSAHILRACAHPVVAQAFEQLLVERGMRMRLADSIDAARLKPSGGLETRFSSDGNVESFDEVICAMGVVPNLAFVLAATLACERGLIVDNHMRTSNPDIYAAGDVAQVNGAQGLWATACYQGRTAAAAITAELTGASNPLGIYEDDIPCTTIHVNDLIFMSAGIMNLEVGQNAEVYEDNGVLVAECATGFNMLAEEGAVAGRLTMLQRAGAMKRRIVSQTDNSHG